MIVSTNLHRRVALLAALLATVVAPAASAQRAADPAMRESALIVKLRGDGPHAVTDCGQRRFASGRGFREATTDGSDSLDEAFRGAGVRRVRALFRSPDAASFQEQRRSLRQRIARRLPSDATVPDLAHVYRIALEPGTDLQEARVLLSRDPHVDYVQVDHTHLLDQIVPGDFGDDRFLYSSGSWGQSYEDLWGLWRIRAPQAWSISRGEGVVVAVVDTGLDYEHPDIAANVWVNPGEDLDGNGVVDPSDWNGVDDDDNGFVDDLRGFDFANSLDADRDGRFDGAGDLGDPDPFDDYGHGTHVAGIIAAVADNGIGIAGVAPGARIMAVKGFRADGSARDSDLWRGVLYAAENGARVINTSWSCNPLCPDNPLAEEVAALVSAMDVVIVTSAGNRLTDVVFNSPEKLRETITVASSGEDDAPSASFTNEGILVDLTAPGGGPGGDASVRIARRNMLSLRSSADLSADYATVAEGYWRTSGTSMAAPHVSGVVALLLAARPELGYEEVRRILRNSAKDLGPPGHDRKTGAGRLDALAALSEPPLPDLVAAVTGPPQGSSFRPGPGQSIEIRGSAAGGDLRSFDLHYGLGNVPESWIPIVRDATEEVDGGVLARWPLDDVGEGTYLVRLTVRGYSGAVYQEFLVVSLERNSFVQVSPQGPPAARPSISGKLVVWESRRSGDEPPLPTDDLNLFASRFDGQHHRLISDAPGDQREASASGRTISWMDSRNGLPRPEIFGCELDRKLCTAFEASAGETTPLPPASIRGGIFWIDSRDGTNDVRACLTGELGCAPVSTGLPPSPRSFLRTDGTTLAWSEPLGVAAICQPDTRTGACARQVPAAPIWPVSRLTASGRLLAWVQKLSARNTRSLQLCELDPDDGSCPAIEVAREVDDPTPSLSGDRLVWETSLGSEEGDIFYCELDRKRQRCPVQRITAHHAPQRNASIDGRRIVWEDDRNGATEIHGIVVPEIAPIADRRVPAGRWLRVHVHQRVSGPDDAPLTLRVEHVGEAMLAELGASFHQLPGYWARGVLDWRPEHPGVYTFTFAGETAAGLVARRTMSIEVRAKSAKAGTPSGSYPGRSAHYGNSPTGSRTGRPAR